VAKLLEQAALLLLDGFELDRTLWRLVNLLRLHLPLDALVITDLLLDLREERVLAEATAKRGRLVNATRPLTRYELAQALSLEPAVIVVNQPKENPLAQDLVEFWGTDDFSLMVLPLIHREARLGSAHFVVRQRRSFSQEHADMAQSLAPPLAMAV